MFDVTYNGVTASSIGIRIPQRPNIPAPSANAGSYSISGRDGYLIEKDGTYSPIQITVDMNFASDTDSGWSAKLREAKKWLLSDGDGQLIFSDDDEYFYKVKYVTVGETERTLRKIGEFSPVFLCDPFQYRIDGLEEYSVSDVLDNPYFVSHPLYIITGGGTCTLTVNGNTMDAVVDSKLTIDTDLMIAYLEDGGYANTSVTGDYDDLYLIEGTNEISITSGFTLKVVPNWRCL